MRVIENVCYQVQADLCGMLGSGRLPDRVVRPKWSCGFSSEAERVQARHHQAER